MANPSPLNPDFGTSIADAIRRQAAAQSKMATMNSQAESHMSPALWDGGTSSNPLDQLMQQIQSINVKSTPLEQLMKQATGAAGSQFDPLIAELQGQMESTKQRGANNQNQARSMYNDLATDIAGQLPQITQQMQQASQETENRYNQTQQELKGQYDQQAQSQAELLKQLGIQAAAPDASQQAMEDQSYFQQQSQNDENSAMQLLSQMKNSDISYNQQSADNSRLAGNNVAQDIGSQLESYLQSAGSKLGGLKAGRESAVQGMLAQLQQQDGQRMQQQEQTQYSRLMDMFNLQLKMQEMQQKNAPKPADPLFKGTNGPSGASNYLSEVYGSNDSFSSKAIMDALNDVMGTPEAVAGQYQSKEFKDSLGQPKMMDVTPEYMTDLLRSRMQNGDSENPLGSQTSFDNADINNAINALMAYMGRLK